MASPAQKVRTAENFDRFADSYERSLAEALAASGEDSRYFAIGRVNWLARCLRQIRYAPLRLLDYGCGPGSTTPILLETLHAEFVLGLDPSERSLEIARQNHASQQLRFVSVAGHQPDASFDLAYCNGVFHHIPPAERLHSLAQISTSLRPGALFAFWENNPWNPGTRHVMAHCAFDRDAITLTPPESKRLLRSAGFEILRTDFLFIFPRLLKLLRPTENLLTRLPLGAQYQVLCRTRF